MFNAASRLLRTLCKTTASSCEDGPALDSDGIERLTNVRAHALSRT